MSGRRVNARCEVGLQSNGCEWPANLEPGGTGCRTRCWRCGNLACRECSVVVRAIRICRDCLTHNPQPGDPPRPR